MTSFSLRFLAVLLLATHFTNASAIDITTYRKIDRRGLNAGEVLVAAGAPMVRQRQNNCETWFYKGSDIALENRMVVVQLCNNKVVSATTELSFKAP